MKAPPIQLAYGFTLIELLTVISIISILSALLLSGTSSAVRSAQRTACLNNLHQMGVGSLLYVDDNRHGAYANTLNDGDDNQNWLHPYIESLKTFSCPATHNRVRPDVFRTNPATGTPELSDLGIYTRKTPFGSSYEVFGFMNFTGIYTTPLQIGGSTTNVPGIQKTVSSVSGYTHQDTVLGLRGIMPGPTQVWLLLDGSPGSGNYPEKRSNHGVSGLNVEFCDGHIEWVTQPKWLRSYELSQDEGRASP